MAHELHVTTPQNYAHTQDILEGLRAQLREIEGAQALARKEANLAESNRAHRLASLGGIAADPRYIADLKQMTVASDAMQSKLDDLAKQHADVKAEVDRLEANPTQDSIPRSAAEAANQNAIAVVDAVSNGEPVPTDLVDPKVVPKSTVYTPTDDPSKSLGSIQAAITTAEGKEVERTVNNIVEVAADRDAKAEKVLSSTDKAIAKAKKAPRSEQYAGDQRDAAVAQVSALQDAYTEANTPIVSKAQELRDAKDVADIEAQKAKTKASKEQK